MNRKYFRLVSVTAVVLALNITTFPVAEARTLSGSHAAAHRTSDLWSATVTWFTGLLPSGQTALRPAASATTTIGGGTGTGHSQPNTGSCIDPMGGHCTPGT
jgi:hypothetical protein